MNEIRFEPRWKEEIVASSKEGKLVFEFTMGVDHVYFPGEAKWLKDAPAWAKDKWEQYLTGCKNWCSVNRVPMTITDDGYFYEER